ncbi:hypothetical protein LA76x_5011 [Lysobacter antibioticus]|uniref:Uncharacterized protein n=1 Tax=Lysobacter antibioticus TaxID=84531 RepID=A0A0S2FHS0_LYSAN|nr:hypothetical protein LA76x_5011 [Lysobacter antibioticus]
MPTDSDAYSAGKNAAEGLLELAPVDIKHGEPGEIEFLLSKFSEDVRAPLERAAQDPEFAAGLIGELGPEGYARLVAATDRTALLDGLNESSHGKAATEMLSLLGQALGSATRMPNSPVDAGFMAKLTENDGFVTDGELDPELAAILLNEGNYTSETAAMLAGHVFLEADPPQIYDRPEGYIDTPAHRASLLTPADHNVEADNVGAWATASHALLRHGGASEMLSLRDSSGNPVVAERLLDPSLTGGTTVMPALVGAILDTPRSNLSTNPNDSAALSAVESLVLANHSRHGDVGEWAREPLGRLYMDYPGEILNIGEGRSAFPAAQSPLGERLANLPADKSGAGADIITAALGADGTPPARLDGPRDPMAPGGGQRYASWQEAIYAATDHYRGQVQSYGPPRDTDVQGTAYVDVEDLADEVSDINAELVQGQFGAHAIAASDRDDDNAAKQAAINVVTDYVALGLGFGAGGGTRAVFANAYNAHAEGPLLNRFFPINGASKVFNATVPEFAQKLVTDQAVQIVNSAALSGSIELPASLLDPATSGLRAPTSGADGAQFAKDLADYIESNDALAEAVDGAAADLMGRVNALSTGAYRGGS